MYNDNSKHGCCLGAAHLGIYIYIYLESEMFETGGQGGQTAVVVSEDGPKLSPGCDDQMKRSTIA